MTLTVSRMDKSVPEKDHLQLFLSKKLSKRTYSLQNWKVKLRVVAYKEQLIKAAPSLSADTLLFFNHAEIALCIGGELTILATKDKYSSSTADVDVSRRIQVEHFQKQRPPEELIGKFEMQNKNLVWQCHLTMF